MTFRMVHLQETDSTNRWLRDEGGSEPCAVWADYQTDGHGQGSNTWESERDSNLTFSVRMFPGNVPARSQFRISMALSLAIVEALGQLIGDVSVKWPNDIYWRNGKICGILIENRLKGSRICETIVGVGLNVNQLEFRSDAPNPVSIRQITGATVDRESLLHDILRRFEACLHDATPGNTTSQQTLRERYMAHLYRRKGFHPYCDQAGAFMAEIADVQEDGHLVLHTEEGQQRIYAFKEVSFVI